MRSFSHTKKTDKMQVKQKAEVITWIIYIWILSLYVLTAIFQMDLG